MSETGGTVTADVGAFTVTTNSGVTEAQLKANLKPKSDAAASQAASELGKRGGQASAKARAEKADEEDLPAAPARNVQDSPEPEHVEPDDEDEADEEKPEEKAEEKPKPPNPRHDPKARMLEATRKEAEAKRALAEERQRREELEARLSALERGTRPSSPEEPPAKAAPTSGWDGVSKPKLADFTAHYDTYEEGVEAYEDARDAWRDREIQQRMQVDAITEAIKAQKTKFAQAVGGDPSAFSEEVLSLKTEFQLAKGEKPDGRTWIANELFFSPEAARPLMLHFSGPDGQDDFQRIAALSTPRAVSREMAKLEARLEAATAGTSSRRDEDVSRAAPPVRPVAGKPYVTESDEWKPGMSLDDYSRIWNRSKRIR